MTLGESEGGEKKKNIGGEVYQETDRKMGQRKKRTDKRETGGTKRRGKQDRRLKSNAEYLTEKSVG